MGVSNVTGQKLITALLAVLVTLPLVAVAEGEEDFNFDDEGEGASEVTLADNTATAAVEEIGPFGGDLWDVAVDTENGMVYTVAKDSPNGFYRSDDAGENWTGLGGVDLGGGVAVEVDTTTGIIYAAFAQGLYQSLDQGVTFTQISSDFGDGLLFTQGMLLSASNSNAGSIIRSTDDGATFTTVALTSATDEYIWDIDYSATDDSYYALGIDGDNQVHLYQSTDAGATWTEVTVPTFTDGVGDARFAVNPLDANNMIISGGYTTNAYYTTTGTAGWTDAGVASSGVTFDQTGRLWLAEQYSDDGGVTWQSYDDDNTSSALGGHNVTVDPSDENVVYADGMPGLSKSTDRGVTWSDINNGISGVTITDLSQATNKDIVWAAAYNGIAKTENFTSANPTWQFPVLEEPGEGIWTNPSNPDIAVVGIIGAIKRTTDGGVTWTDNLVSSLIDSRSQVDDIIADVADSDTLYAGVSNGDPSMAKVGQVLVSHDQGVTWEDMNLLDAGSAQSISQASNGDIYVGMGAESEIDGVNGIYKYSAGNWSELTNSPDEDIVKVIVDPNDDNLVYAIAGVLYNNGTGDNFGFYKSEDAGETWTKITDGLEELRGYTSLTTQASTSPTTLYLGAENFFGQGTLLKSSDAGDSWGVLYTGLQDETFYTLLFDGITLGSSRGLFVLNSKASLNLTAVKKRVTVGTKATLNLTLKDATTNRKLKNKPVTILRKRGSSYKVIDTVHTNRKGKVEYKVKLSVAKKYYFKAKWKPTGDAADEYIKVTSDALKVTGVN